MESQVKLTTECSLLLQIFVRDNLLLTLTSDATLKLLQWLNLKYLQLNCVSDDNDMPEMTDDFHFSFAMFIINE